MPDSVDGPGGPGVVFTPDMGLLPEGLFAQGSSRASLDRLTARHGLAGDGSGEALQKFAPKIGTLRDSRIYWKLFQQQAISRAQLEMIQTYVAGNHGYLSKQEFLAKARQREQDLYLDGRYRKK